MNASQFIDAVERRNPELFRGEAIKITPQSLRAVLRQAFEMGERNAKPAAQSDPMDIFNSVFRK